MSSSYLTAYGNVNEMTVNGQPVHFYRLTRSSDGKTIYASYYLAGGILRPAMSENLADLVNFYRSEGAQAITPTTIISAILRRGDVGVAEVDSTGAVVQQMTGKGPIFPLPGTADYIPTEDESPEPYYQPPPPLMDSTVPIPGDTRPQWARDQGVTLDEWNKMREDFERLNPPPSLPPPSTAEPDWWATRPQYMKDSGLTYAQWLEMQQGYYPERPGAPSTQGVFCNPMGVVYEHRIPYEVYKISRGSQFLMYEIFYSHTWEGKDGVLDSVRSTVSVQDVVNKYKDIAKQRANVKWIQGIPAVVVSSYQKDNRTWAFVEENLTPLERPEGATPGGGVGDDPYEARIRAIRAELDKFQWPADRAKLVGELDDLLQKEADWLHTTKPYQPDQITDPYNVAILLGVLGAIAAVGGGIAYAATRKKGKARKMKAWG